MFAKHFAAEVDAGLRHTLPLEVVGVVLGYIPLEQVLLMYPLSVYYSPGLLPPLMQWLSLQPPEDWAKYVRTLAPALPTLPKTPRDRADIRKPELWLNSPAIQKYTYFRDPQLFDLLNYYHKYPEPFDEFFPNLGVINEIRSVKLSQYLCFRAMRLGTLHQSSRRVPDVLRMGALFVFKPQEYQNYDEHMGGIIRLGTVSPWEWIGQVHADKDSVYHTIQKYCMHVYRNLRADQRANIDSDFSRWCRECGVDAIVDEDADRHGRKRARRK